MPDIFISYAKEDSKRVKQLVKVIESNGWDAWWDHDIPAGKNYDEVIENAINNCKCALVLWTNASVTSRWVKAEADLALSQNKLIPLLIDEVEIPLAFRTVQAADLSDWDGTSDHPQFVRLKQDIQRLLGPKMTSSTVKEQKTETPTTTIEEQKPAEEQPAKTNKGLIIGVSVAILLIVAIFAIRKIGGGGGGNNNALSAAEQNDLWGFVDKNGKWVIKPQYDNAKEFVDGSAQVKKDGHIFFINKNNKCVKDCPETSDETQSMSELAMSYYGLLNEAEQFVKDGDYESALDAFSDAATLARYSDDLDGGLAQLGIEKCNELIKKKIKEEGEEAARAEYNRLKNDGIKAMDEKFYEKAFNFFSSAQKIKDTPEIQSLLLKANVAMNNDQGSDARDNVKDQIILREVPKLTPDRIKYIKENITLDKEIQ